MFNKNTHRMEICDRWVWVLKHCSHTHSLTRIFLLSRSNLVNSFSGSVGSGCLQPNTPAQYHIIKSPSLPSSLPPSRTHSPTHSLTHPMSLMNPSRTFPNLFLTVLMLHISIAISFFTSCTPTSCVGVGFISHSQFVLLSTCTNNRI